MNSTTAGVAPLALQAVDSMRRRPRPIWPTQGSSVLSADLNSRFSQSEHVAGGRFAIADITAFVSVEFGGAVKEKVSE